MKYYLKHILRAIRQRPFQPMLLFFIFLLAFVVMVTAISATNAIDEEKEDEYACAIGKAQMTVEIGSASPSRFLTVKSVTDVLPEAEVTGSFSLPYLAGETLVTGYALDFEVAGKFFNLCFTERDTVSYSEKNTSLFVTKDFAEEHHLSLGDTICLSLFGKDVSYMVKGISTTPFLGTGDVICDISGVVSMLIGQSDFLSALAGGTAVWGKLYVYSDVYTESEMKSALEATFSDYSISATARAEMAEGDSFILRGIALMILVFTALSALAVSSGCSYCLAKERAEYTYLFSLVGFTAKQNYFLRVLEMLLYSGMAVGCGCFLSFPVGNMIYDAMGLRLEHFKLSFGPVALASLALIAVSFFSPLLAGRKRGNKVSGHSLVVIGLCATGVTLVTVAMSFIVPTNVKFYMALVGIITGILALALLAHPALALFTSFCCGFKSIIGKLSRNNCLHVGELSNSCRLLAILISIIILISFLAGAATVITLLYPHVLNGEYVIAGGNAETKAIAESLDEVSDVYTIRMANEWTLDNGRSIYVWGVDTLDVFKDDFKGESFPATDEIMCFVSYQEGFGLPSTGNFNIHKGNATETYRIRTVENGIYAFCVTSCDGIKGNATDYYVVKAVEGVSDADLYRALTEALSTRMVTVLPSSELINSYIEKNQQYLCFCQIMLAALGVFGILGIGNNLLESIRSRKEELNSFVTCGMTKRQVRLMLLWEFLMILAVALVLSIVTFMCLAPLSVNGLKTFGSDILTIYRKYFNI